MAFQMMPRGRFPYQRSVTASRLASRLACRAVFRLPPFASPYRRAESTRRLNLPVPAHRAVYGFGGGLGSMWRAVLRLESHMARW